MSSIHYKFRSLKDYDTYTFEGAGVPVWELKQEIINTKKLNRANDFDLIISNAQTNQEYTDEGMIIPKNTSVIVRRVPAGPGRRYYQPRTLTARPTGSTTASSGMLPFPSVSGDEESKIAAMLTESSSHWSQNQQMPSQTQFSASRKNIRPKLPTAPPPSNYICFRCGQKGHYIANCPTNTDPNYNRPKIRKTTGIPKTFLKPVESRPDQEGPMGGTLPPSGNILISAEGTLVMMETNEALWNKLAGISRVPFLNSDAAPEHFKCPLCARILTDPVYFSCCPSVNYCDECIRNFLLKNENSKKASTCRSCRRPVLVDDLRSNTDLAREISDYYGNYASAPKGEDDESRKGRFS